MRKNAKYKVALIGGCFLIFICFLLIPGFWGQNKNQVGAGLSGLVGYWDFDTPIDFQEDDHSGRGNHGYFTGGLWGIKGVIGYTVKFGGGDMLNMGDRADFDFDRLESFSLLAWVKLDEKVGDYRSIMGKASSESKDGYVLRTQTNGAFSMMIEASDSSREANAIANHDYRDGHWHLVVGVVDRNRQKVMIYVDGKKKQETEAEQVGNLNNEYHFNIGSLDRTAVWFKGLIDEAKVYRRALSAEEIEQEYQKHCASAGACFNVLDEHGAGSLLMSRENNKVYYINQKLQKKWIINPYVFDLYGNQWPDVKIVAEAELSAFETVNLMRAIRGERVYYISNTTREWIKTVQEFERRGFEWQDVDQVKMEELLAYDEI